MAIHEIQRSALVTFTPEQMFDLVVDVERYPEFLPWVGGAEVHEKSRPGPARQLEMQRGRREGAVHHAQRDGTCRTG